MKYQPLKYTSKGKRISESLHHPEMFIVDLIGTDKFYTMQSTREIMLRNNPPDPTPQTKKSK